jgi:RNA polymerase sigma-70 factor (subfamily 1)
LSTSIDRLLAQAQQGDRVAMGRLLMLYDQRLRRRLAQRISVNLRRVLSVEDVLQETYGDAYRHVRRFESRGPQAFYNWLAAIAERKLIDAVKAIRASKRSPRPGARRIAADRSTSFLGLARLVDEKGKTPSKAIARQEAVRAVRVALASLPEPCRRAVWLRHIEGKQVSEIAAVLGRTERAVHQLCYRGLQRLREQMGSRSKYLSDSE